MLYLNGVFIITKCRFMLSYGIIHLTCWLLLNKQDLGKNIHMQKCQSLRTSEIPIIINVLVKEINMYELVRTVSISSVRTVCTNYRICNQFRLAFGDLL